MKIRFNTQYVYSLIVAYMLSFLALLSLGNEIFNMIGVHTVLDTVLMYGAMFALVLLGLVMLVDNGKYFKVDVFVVVAFFVLSYFSSVVLFPNNESFIFTSLGDYAQNPVYILFIYSLPSYVFVRQIKDYGYFNSLMRGFSYIVVIMSIVVFFFAKGSSASQYMTFSYNMLTQLFFLLINKPNKYKVLHYTVVFFGVFVLVFGGARGAMIFFLLGYLVYYFYNHKTTLKNVVLSMLATVFVFLLALFKGGVLALIGKALDTLSIDSRNFEFLINGNLLDSENRLPMYQRALDEIGIFGKGIMGDRVAFGFYPHNMFLEILVQFGFFIGLALCALLLVILVKAMLKRNRPEFIYILLLLPCGFLKLLLTGSYLNQEPALYALLGFCVNAIMRGKTYANTNDQYGIRYQ